MPWPSRFSVTSPRRRLWAGHIVVATQNRYPEHLPIRPSTLWYGLSRSLELQVKWLTRFFIRFQ